MAQTTEVNQARAVLRYFRMSPTKARQVLDLIRGKSAVDAIRALSLVNREASEVVGKLLASAVANATVRYGLGADEVFVAAAFADEGPTIKRFRPRARGRATRIRKRSCHITIVVEEMPLEMRRVEAAKSSGRQTARRAQRVASSRGNSQQRDPQALGAGADGQDSEALEPVVDGVDTSTGELVSNDTDSTIVEVDASEIQPIVADSVDAVSDLSNSGSSNGDDLSSDDSSVDASGDLAVEVASVEDSAEVVDDSTDAKEEREDS